MKIMFISDIDAYKGGFYPVEKMTTKIGEFRPLLNKVHHDMIQKSLLDELLDSKIDNLRKERSLPKSNFAKPVDLNQGGLMKDWDWSFQF